MAVITAVLVVEEHKADRDRAQGEQHEVQNHITPAGELGQLGEAGHGGEVHIGATAEGEQAAEGTGVGVKGVDKESAQHDGQGAREVDEEGVARLHPALVGEDLAIGVPRAQQMIHKQLFGSGQ